MPRSRFVRWAIALSLLAVLIAALPLLGYWGTQHVPSYYAEKLKQEEENRETARAASHEMARKVGALAGDVHRPGEWTALFSADQINGWLAVDLIEKHAEAIPQGVHNPRVFIDANKATIACYYDQVWPPAVYTLDVEPYVPAPNKLAVRLKDFRAGAVPVPLSTILDSLKQAALRKGLPLEWGSLGGDPVAIITLPPSEDLDRRKLVLEAIQLEEGAIILSGRTLDEADSASPPSALRWHIQVASHSDAKAKVQR